MMTKKDYIKVADILSRHYKEAETPAHQEAVKRLAKELARFFAADNPRFDYDRFYKHIGCDRACGCVVLDGGNCEI